MIFCTFYYAKDEDSDPTVFACAGECVCDCVNNFINSINPNYVVHDEFLVSVVDDWSTPVWHKIKDYLHDD